MTVTAEQAVNALNIAGDNIPALEKAIEAASWLDDHPGDDRQILRGVCARVVMPVAIL